MLRVPRTRDRLLPAHRNHPHRAAAHRQRVGLPVPLRGVCESRGIRQKRIKPHCLWQNGKLKRFSRTTADRVGHQQQPSASNDERTGSP